MFLVISSSLHPESRSRILAKSACEMFADQDQDCHFVDLMEFELPRCDGVDCYSDANVVALSEQIKTAQGILLATPIYNYSISASAKNMIELTGASWTEKVVGFLCAAGGRSSYMSVMGVANSLMLDFHSFILPRFIYTTGDSFQGDQLADVDVRERLESLIGELARVTNCLLN